MLAGSGKSDMRGSAHTRSQSAQASLMVLVSFPMIFSVVRSRRMVIWVKRQKKNSSWLAFSNQRLAVSECTCRLHRSANQTLASRIFNVFIDLFARQLNLGTFGSNQGKLDSFWPRSLAFQKHTPDACQNQLANGAASGGGLLLQLSVKGFRNINRRANRFLLHKNNYRIDAINMEALAISSSGKPVSP